VDGEEVQKRGRGAASVKVKTRQAKKSCDGEGERRFLSKTGQAQKKKKDSKGLNSLVNAN